MGRLSSLTPDPRRRQVERWVGITFLLIGVALVALELAFDTSASGLVAGGLCLFAGGAALGGKRRSGAGSRPD